MSELFRGYANAVAINFKTNETNILFVADRPQLRPDGKIENVLEEIANITMTDEFTKVFLAKLTDEFNRHEAARAADLAKQIEAAKALRNKPKDMIPAGELVMDEAKSALKVVPPKK